MGLFDWYEPRPILMCPECGSSLQGWQGKSGTCALLVWKQGERHPIDQRADEDVKVSLEELRRFELPDRFLIYTDCCNPDFHVDAICSTTNHVWTTTKLMKSEDVEEFYYYEPRAKRRARKRWLDRRTV